MDSSTTLLPEIAAMESEAKRRGEPELVYEKVADYHLALRAGDPPVISSRGKSRCAGDIDLGVEQAMLDEGVRKGMVEGALAGLPKNVYALRDGTWYRAQPHGRGKYHGHPVVIRRVPPQVRRLA